jgi:lipopolysaccharide/colanic/teichoic acid biosynthesis glycosyltransferase
MSLVGPRPLPVDGAAFAPAERRRLLVKPGITGLWQVSGRSSANPADYERLDLYYVDNWSLIIDVTILLRTIPAVLLRRGAS